MQKSEKAWSIPRLFPLVPKRFLVVGGNRVFGQSSKNLFEPFLCSSSSCSYFVTLRVLLYQESVSFLHCIQFFNITLREFFWESEGRVLERMAGDILGVFLSWKKGEGLLRGGWVSFLGSLGSKLEASGEVLELLRENLFSYGQQAVRGEGLLDVSGEIF